MNEGLYADQGERVPNEDLAQCVGRLFATSDGVRLSDHLERVFLLRRVSPQSSDQELRHIEGQRSLAAHLLSLASRGRSR